MAGGQEQYLSGFEDFTRRAGHAIEFRRPKAHPHMRLIPIDPVPISHAHFAVVVTQEDSRVLPHPAGNRVELVLEKQHAEHYFAALDARRAEIDAQIPAVDWHDAPLGSASHIDLWKPGHLGEWAHWPEDFSWLLEKLLSFRRVLGPIVREAAQALRR